MVYNKSKLFNFLTLQLAFLIYSFVNIFFKIASRFEIFSYKFIIFYGIGMALLFIYAIIWQQVIKKFTLGIAYANKAITIFWGLLWSYLLFNEEVKLNNVIGGIIIMVGIIIIMVKNDD